MGTQDAYKEECMCRTHDLRSNKLRGDGKRFPQNTDYKQALSGSSLTPNAPKASPATTSELIAPSSVPLWFSMMLLRFLEWYGKNWQRHHLLPMLKGTLYPLIAVIVILAFGAVLES